MGENKGTVDQVDGLPGWVSEGNPSEAWRLGVLEALSAAGLWLVASRLEDCGKPLSFFCSNCGHRKVGQYHCRSRVCLSCSRSFSNGLQKRVHDRSSEIQKTCSSYNFQLRMITLTVRTNGDLSGSIRTMSKALPLFWRKVLRRGVGKKITTGWVCAYEFGPKNLNLHVHSLYYGPFIPQAKLSDEWRKLTGSFIVDIRLADAGASREVIKYMTDLRKLTPEQVVEVFQAMEGLRRIRTYGLYFGVEHEEELSIKKEGGDDSCECCGCTEFISEKSLYWMEKRARSG